MTRSTISAVKITLKPKLAVSMRSLCAGDWSLWDCIITTTLAVIADKMTNLNAGVCTASKSTARTRFSGRLAASTEIRIAQTCFIVRR